MIFLAILEYAILASTFTIAKVAVGYADPLFLIGVRMIVSAPLMFLVHGVQKNSSFKIAKSDIRIFILVSLFHVFLPFVGEFWALQFMSSAKTAITYSLTPFIAAVLSYFVLRKKISSKQTLGLVIGLLGLLPILVSGDEVDLLQGEFFFVSMPEIVLLIAVTSSSYAWFLVSDLMKKGYGISYINGIAMFLGGLLSLCVWYVSSGDTSPIRGDINDFLIWTALLVLVANVISYNFYGWLLKHMSITLMSAIGFLCPLFASFYGLVLLNEELGYTHLVALLMVGVGIWLFYREEVRTYGPRKFKSH
jgi:drug/metabolite transporter (DMT)-like permease